MKGYLHFVSEKFIDVSGLVAFFYYGKLRRGVV